MYIAGVIAPEDAHKVAMIAGYLGVDMHLEGAAAYAAELLQGTQHRQAYFGHTAHLAEISIRTKHAATVIFTISS